MLAGCHRVVGRAPKVEDSGQYLHDDGKSSERTISLPRTPRTSFPLWVVVDSGFRPLTHTGVHVSRSTVRYGFDGWSVTEGDVDPFLNLPAPTATPRHRVRRRPLPQPPRTYVDSPSPSQRTTPPSTSPYPRRLPVSRHGITTPVSPLFRGPTRSLPLQTFP